MLDHLACEPKLAEIKLPADHALWPQCPHKEILLLVQLRGQFHVFK